MQSNSVGVTDFIKKLQSLIDLITLIMWKKRMEFWHDEANNKTLLISTEPRFHLKDFFLPVRYSDL